MSEEKEVQAKYICLDIVEYTKGSVEGQLDILAKLNEIVKASVDEYQLPEYKVMYLPTGDGMCIAILNTPSPVDLHLLVAVSILKRISNHNSNEVAARQFQVRIGIHSHTDNVVKDIKGDNNIAGAGINTAFRIMDLADGMQILVGEPVFLDLHRHEVSKKFLESGRYSDYLVKCEATVKHGEPLTVYQLKGENEKRLNVAWLNEETPEAVQDYSDFIKPALALGLKKVYTSRDRNNVGEDVLKEIEQAKERVWLLGVGLFYPPELRISDPEFIAKLDHKLKSEQNFDLKILLLDGLRSPAIFRALLESNCDKSRSIVKFERRLPRNDDPYFTHPLYLNFRNAYERLSAEKNSSRFKAAVRFYGHAPSCWMVIIDDKAYYQPYTFGDISHDSQTHTIGHQMPVIKLQGDTAHFRLLKDHFIKLWLTSDTGLFHTGARITAKAKVLWETFVKRKGSKWFGHVNGVLCNEKSPGQDRRTHLRQPCISALNAFITWEDGKGEKVRADIIDFSVEGAFLELDLAFDSERFTSLPEDHRLAEEKFIVRIDVEPEGGWPALRYRRAATGIPDVDAAEYLVNGFLKPSNHRFIFIRKKPGKREGKPRMAFQAHMN